MIIYEHQKQVATVANILFLKKNGMYVEIQLRTQLQHLWATSVETIDIFRGTTLKEIEDATCWHDFFCQVSSVFAITEKSPVVPVYTNLGISELCDVLQNNITKNFLMHKIASFALTDTISNNPKLKKAYYMVITLDSNKKKATMNIFKESDYHLAFERYKHLEQKNTPGEQSVLIALNQIKKVRDAYPNYFMNLKNFSEMIKFILAKNQR